MSRTIEVSEETYEKIKEQLNEREKLDISSLDDIIGKKWFFRTVTYHLIGKVKSRMGGFFVLENASWIADSGGFSDAIKKGELDEVEPVGDAIINIDSVTDFYPWIHDLPKDQK